MREAIVEVEDDDFLSQVAALEADALSAKRRKITASNPTNEESGAEGAYMAVLRGSTSHLFQQQFTTTAASGTSAANSGSLGGGDSCFNCGKSGHWARDCDANSYAVDSSAPEKACPCGLGSCLVLTANTVKNRGRKFYKCPLREESGGCGFFEWCDKPSGTDIMTFRSQSSTSNPSIPELSCACGAGSCLILTAKTGKNIGQQFYCCPASQGSCGFFKWCNDHMTAGGLSDSISTSKVYKNNIHEMSNKNYGAAASGSCFRCGKDGHWSKDCPQSSFQSPPNSGGKSVSSNNTCYKCGKPGHWAKDCSSSA